MPRPSNESFTSRFCKSSPLSPKATDTLDSRRRAFSVAPVQEILCMILRRSGLFVPPPSPACAAAAAQIRMC
jgi:hypothetical protein